MILEPFQYFSPSSLGEAHELLLQYGSEAKIIAGGQSLIPIMKLGTEIPYLIDIKRIKELSYVREAKNSSGEVSALEIGALTRYCEIESSALIKKNLPLLSRTASGIGHPLVRNRGTIGGSLSHCDPAADLCATALALNGVVNISTPDGSARKVSAPDFFKGPLETDLKEGEILRSVSFPLSSLKSGYDLQKLTLGHGDFPILLVSVSLHHDGSVISDAAIALGGVADTAVRVRECEEMVDGERTITDAYLDAVGKKVSSMFEGPPSLELSREYTKKMIGVFTRRALSNAIHMITG